MAAGYDVMYLAGLATGGPEFLYRKRGWPSLAAAGPAAAATAARVMGLGDDGAGHAMALALLSTPAGLRAGTEDGRWLSFGLAVAAGVEAALATRAGARGDLRTLENAARAGQGPFGDLKQMRTSSWQPGQGLAGAQLKRWASAAQVAAAIDAAGALRDEDGIRTGELAAVDVYVPADHRQMIDQPARAGRVWSLLSAQYQIAVALLHPGDLYDCAREMLRGSARFRALMGIISVHHGADLEHLYPRHYPARVEVTLSGGRKLARLSAGRSPSPRWDWDTVTDKALKLCSEDAVRRLQLATAGADLAGAEHAGAEHAGAELAGDVLACIDRMLGVRSPVA
jgi:2-methylcitrate dehydratase PrpD